MQVLTELKAKSIKEIGRFADGTVRGLHIWVKSPNTKYWILRFTLNGKRRDMSIGAYPEKTIKDARYAALDAKRLVDEGIDPIAFKKIRSDEFMATESRKMSFKQFALQCVAEKRNEWRNEKHAQQWIYTLEEFAFPIIGSMNRPV